jgi:hypothetical protein
MQFCLIIVSKHVYSALYQYFETIFEMKFSKTPQYEVELYILRHPHLGEISTTGAAKFMGANLLNDKAQYKSEQNGKSSKFVLCVRSA